MWVKSQNRKKLLNVNFFEIEEVDYCEEKMGKFVISTVKSENIYTAYEIMTNEGCVGYFLKERNALELLYKIEKAILDGVYIFNIPTEEEMELMLNLPLKQKK